MTEKCENVLTIIGNGGCYLLHMCTLIKNHEGLHQCDCDIEWDDELWYRT